MLETDLWCSKNQRLSIVPQHLAAKKMEIVGGHCDLSNLEVDILSSQFVIRSIDTIIGLRIDILKESLYMAGGVLGASAIKAVRQEQDHAALSEPFGL